ncbi:MAG: hypothetical protein GY754_07430 [bacterium]|nr:hypothetical protein [bacterium]
MKSREILAIVVSICVVSVCTTGQKSKKEDIENIKDISRIVVENSQDSSREFKGSKWIIVGLYPKSKDIFSSEIVKTIQGLTKKITGTRHVQQVLSPVNIPRPVFNREDFSLENEPAKESRDTHNPYYSLVYSKDRSSAFIIAIASPGIEQTDQEELFKTISGIAKSHRSKALSIECSGIPLALRDRRVRYFPQKQNLKNPGLSLVSIRIVGKGSILDSHLLHSLDDFSKTLKNDYGQIFSVLTPGDIVKQVTFLTHEKKPSYFEIPRLSGKYASQNYKQLNNSILQYMKMYSETYGHPGLLATPDYSAARMILLVKNWTPEFGRSLEKEMIRLSHSIASRGFRVMLSGQEEMPFSCDRKIAFPGLSGTLVYAAVKIKDPDSRSRGNPQDFYYIRLVDFASGTVKEIPCKHSVKSIDISPAGKQLVAHMRIEQRRYNSFGEYLVIYDLEKNIRKIISEPDTDCHSPQFTSSGEHLFFQTGAYRHNPDLYICRSDGSSLKKLFSIRGHFINIDMHPRKLRFLYTLPQKDSIIEYDISQKSKLRSLVFKCPKSALYLQGNQSILVNSCSGLSILNPETGSSIPITTPPGRGHSLAEINSLCEIGTPDILVFSEKGNIYLYDYSRNIKRLISRNDYTASTPVWTPRKIAPSMSGN